MNIAEDDGSDNNKPHTNRSHLLCELIVLSGLGGFRMVGSLNVRKFVFYIYRDNTFISHMPKSFKISSTRLMRRRNAGFKDLFPTSTYSVRKNVCSPITVSLQEVDEIL